MSSRPEIVYFLGIGGIGMSALARWFHSRGLTVMGYDRYPSGLTTALEIEGMAINYTDSAYEIPQLLHVPENKSKTLVIYTPAIPADNKQLLFFKENGFELRKRAAVLGDLTRGMDTIAVGGTHGKTTTSSMVAHILHTSGYGCNAFLGGIAANTGSNVILNPKSNRAVVEADEFDRSFLTLSPRVAIITSTDADHLDIYGHADEVKASFGAFADKVIPGGTLLAQYQTGLRSAHGHTLTYGAEQGDFHSTDLRIEGGSYKFNIMAQRKTTGPFLLKMPGRHNLENAVAAIAACMAVGLDPEAIAAALAHYRGVKRRWEIVFRNTEVVYVDDYAHHPSELNAAIAAARQFYPDMPVYGFFQPHLFTRTRDFADGFAKALSSLDTCFLLPIYPARELPIEGITSAWLLSKMPSGTHRMVHPEEVPALAAGIKRGVIMTLGAGDIDRLVQPIHQILTNPNNKP